MWRTNSLEKTLMLGKIEGKRRRRRQRMAGMDGWMASPTQWTWVWVNSRGWWWTGRPGMVQSMGSQWVRHDWATELNWTADISIQSPRSPVWPSRCLMFSVSGDSGSPYHCHYSGMTTLSNPVGVKIPSSSVFAWPVGLPDQTKRASIQVCEVLCEASIQVWWLFSMDVSDLRVVGQCGRSIDCGWIQGIPLSCQSKDSLPLQYSCLENPMDGRAWWATVRGVAKSRTRLSDFTSLHFSHDIQHEITALTGWRGVDFNWGGLILIRKSCLGVVLFNVLQCEAGFWQVDKALESEEIT